MKSLSLHTSEWSSAELQEWFERRGLVVDGAALAQGGPAAVTLQRGLWPGALVPVRSIRIGNSRVFRANATEYRSLHAFFIEVLQEDERWVVSLRRDPSWFMAMVGWGAGGTLVLSWPFAAIMTASGTPPAWLEPWWRMALLKLALAVLALLPALLILQWLRDGRNSRTAYQALLSELKSNLKEPSVGGTVSFEIKAE